MTTISENNANPASGRTVSETRTAPMQNTLNAKNKNEKYSDTYIRQAIVPTLQEMLLDYKKHYIMVYDAHRFKLPVARRIKIAHAKIMLKILETIQGITNFFVLSIAEIFTVLFKTVISLLQGFLVAFIVSMGVYKLTGYDLTAASWFLYVKNIYIFLAFFVAVIERLDFWGIIGTKNRSCRREYKKKEKIKKKNEEKRRELVYQESKKLKQESLAKITGFSPKYWNEEDLENMIFAFSEGKAKTWNAAYRYARKQR